VYDLDERLERLAAEAARDAVPPEVAVIARRGRRRRRRRLAGSAALVAAVVAAGLVLPAYLAGRPAGGARPLPATGGSSAPDVAGAATLGGYWFGKADAAVFLRLDVTTARREAIRRRIQSLDVVDTVYFESQAEAWARLQELYRSKPGAWAKVDPAALPESFRVRLRAPEDFEALERALCPRPPGKAKGGAPCMDGVETVVDSRMPLLKTLVSGRWAATSDATVFLPDGAGAAERRAVEARLAAIAGVVKVTWESPQEAYRRLPEKLLRAGRDPAVVTPLFTPKSVPGAFHVALERPARVGRFHLALCGSRTTGACEGLVVLEHPRR
jgi:cell division protein FtsX